MKSNEEYFKSKLDMYVFILLHTDGESRCDLLGITNDLYHDSDKALAWYKPIFMYLVDQPFSVIGDSATILRRIFDRMVK